MIANIGLHIQWFWVLLEPLLFGLIGTYIDFFSLDMNIVAKAVAMLFVGLFFRILGVLLSLTGTD